MAASKRTKKEFVEEAKVLYSSLEELRPSEGKHKQVEDVLKESKEHAKIFASYQHAISELREFYIREASFEQMLQKAADLFIKNFGYYMAWYGELKSDEKVIIPKVWAGKYEKYLNGLRLELDDSKDAKCAMSLAIIRNESFGYTDLEHDKDFEKWRPLAIKYGYRSNQAIPLIINGKSVGAFLIYSTRPRAFSEYLIGYLGGMVNELATIVENITERKRAEEAYRALVDHSLQGLAIFQDGRVVFANQAMAEIIGYTLDEMLAASSQKVREFVHPEDRAQVWGRHKDRLRGKRVPERYELRGIRKDGTICWLEIHASRIEYQGKYAIQAAYVDITERKKAEEERIAAIQERAAVVDAVSDSVIVLNLDGQIISCNPAHLKMFHRSSADEILGKNFSELREVFCHPELDIPRMLGVFRAVVQNSTSEPVEIRVRRADGEELTVSASVSLQKDAMGNPLNVIAILRDITPQKRLQRMEKEAAVTRMAVETIEGMLEAVTIMDLDGKIRQVNSEFERGSGYKKEEAVGKTAIELGIISKEENQRIEKEIIPKLMKEGFIRNIEIVVVNKDGITFPALMSWRLMKDAQGNPKGIIATVTDITELKQAEEQLREYQWKLRSMASELSLIGERERRHIATELHDHIAQSLVFSKMRLDELQVSAASADFGKPLRQISDLLERVIQQTQTLTYDLGSPTLYELGLKAAIQEWLSEEVGQKHNIATFFKYDGPDKRLGEDISALLFRAVRELLVNVIKHAHAKNVEVSIQRKADKIKIFVVDDGIGFELANTSVSRDKKHSYGLFSIKENLNHIGGCLDIKSEQGRGTQAVMTVPLKENDIKSGS